MTLTNDYPALKAQYEAAGQGHVFTFYNDLSAQEQEAFLDQLKMFDPEELSKIALKAMGESKQPAVKQQACLEPLPRNVTDKVCSASADRKEGWKKLGMDLIRQNKVAVILMAGGQGTRLGSDAPKGCYDIGLPSHKSLFQLQAERILRLQALARGDREEESIIPWYIMTSGPTHEPTCEFFEKHNYFGLSRDNVIFFKQGVMPCFTEDGKLMLQEKGKLAIAPDGNGGIYSALHREGIIASLKKRGVLYSHCYCVDNSLARVADPVFIGYCASKSTDCGIKVVPKSHPEEPVGVVCKCDDKYGVVEYSEISKELAFKRQEDGTLAFGAANIANHFFSTEFLERVPSFAHTLAYHVAHKKIPYTDLTNGQFIKPTKNNGVKLERFVFDVFGHSHAFSVLEVGRALEFSPLKNGSGAGVDCPETSRADILQQHAQFIIEAGGHVKDGVSIEISPLVSYAGEGLEIVKGKTVIQSGVVKTIEDLKQMLA
ncbi:nucleotide-diphospho-sugar transferase [Radiomyces spectabilis]|uniref:nucleotide-diphospho-sugar transferase n=1 Tax=Radiomyces spectabilis TaxID=64574 RepID=UPI00221E9135|nr:nucleotide-diphospho-sugar transferase [Radiomyces spectabilis]KAI8371703.1 nucleotide-diphospho-sugar transferase [Radiomyces spectabilis]